MMGWRDFFGWAPPIQAAAAPDPKPAASPKPVALEQIVLPRAQDRWMGSAVRSYTPDTIETTIRGAFAGRLDQVWELYDLMESTWPRLAKNLNELKDAVASMDVCVEAWALKGEEPSDEAERRARLLDTVLWQMRPDPAVDENNFRATLRDLLDAWGKGMSVVELVWEVTESAEAGRYIAPRCTRWVHPRYYGYPGFAEGGDRLMLNRTEIEAQGVRPRLGSGLAGDYIPFPADKFLIAVAKQKTGHPVGGALLRPLAFWWCAANFSAEWWLNFAQLFGVPIRWATYDPNQPGLLDQLTLMLDGMGSSAWAALPAGTTMELKEPTKSGSDNPQVGLLERADKNCDLLILGQTLTSDVGDSGSRALGDVHETVRSDRKTAAAEWLTSVLNEQLAPAFCRLNWGDTRECPWIFLEHEQTKDAKGMAERDQILLGAGVEMPKGWFYERHDIPMPQEGEDVIKKSAPPAMPGIPGHPGRPGTPAEEPGVDAKDATEALTERVLEDLTGVQARWLGGVKPFFRELVQAAQDESLTDGEFTAILAKAQREIPELFGQLDRAALSKALEAAMGAAVVNGAVEGHLKRRVRR